ncbi:MAG: hypothetical protein OEV44_06295 [Spirochaetota bacterium]|nr:hypothetical protein [Spirochaetota bacterium]
MHKFLKKFIPILMLTFTFAYCGKSDLSSSKDYFPNWVSSVVSLDISKLTSIPIVKSLLNQEKAKSIIEEMENETGIKLNNIKKFTLGTDDGKKFVAKLSVDFNKEKIINFFEKKDNKFLPPNIKKEGEKDGLIIYSSIKNLKFAFDNGKNIFVSSQLDDVLNVLSGKEKGALTTNNNLLNSIKKVSDYHVWLVVNVTEKMIADIPFGQKEIIDSLRSIQSIQAGANYDGSIKIVAFAVANDKEKAGSMKQQLDSALLFAQMFIKQMKIDIKTNTSQSGNIIELKVDISKDTIENVLPKILEKIGGGLF